MEPRFADPKLSKWLQQMITSAVSGNIWHADHVIPVYEVSPSSLSATPLRHPHSGPRVFVRPPLRLHWPPSTLWITPSLPSFLRLLFLAGRVNRDLRGGRDWVQLQDFPAVTAVPIGRGRDMVTMMVMEREREGFATSVARRVWPGCCKEGVACQTARHASKREGNWVDVPSVACHVAGMQQGRGGRETAGGGLLQPQEPRALWPVLR